MYLFNITILLLPTHTIRTSICKTWVPFQTPMTNLLVSFNSDTTGVTGGSGTVNCVHAGS